MDQTNDSGAPPEAATDASAPKGAEAQAPKPLDTHKPVEEWARLKKTDALWLNAARVAHHWAIGRELEEKDYDAAIDAVQKVEIR